MNRNILVAIGLLASAIVVQVGGHAAQSPVDTLRLAAASIGALDLDSVSYSGSGSSYALGLDDEGQHTREYARVANYTQEIDYASLSSRLIAERLVGEDRTEVTESRTIDAETPWESQLDLWMNPHLFLQQALSRDASAEAVTDLGVDYQVVSFETPGGHILSGYIDGENKLAKIRTEIGDHTIEGSFREYEEFDGIQFPTMIFHKLDGSPTLILIVKDVEQGGPTTG